MLCAANMHLFQEIQDWLTGDLLETFAFLASHMVRIPSSYRSLQCPHQELGPGLGACVVQGVCVLVLYVNVATGGLVKPSSYDEHVRVAFGLQNIFTPQSVTRVILLVRGQVAATVANLFISTTQRSKRTLRRYVLLVLVLVATLALLPSLTFGNCSESFWHARFVAHGCTCRLSAITLTCMIYICGHAWQYPFRLACFKRMCCEIASAYTIREQNSYMCLSGAGGDTGMLLGAAMTCSAMNCLMQVISEPAPGQTLLLLAGNGPSVSLQSVNMHLSCTSHCVGMVPGDIMCE